MSLRFFILGIVVMVSGMAQSQVSKVPPACTCDHLESLQQDYQNAVYLADFKLKLANHLREVEIRQADINKNDPTNKDAGTSIHLASKVAREAYEKKNFKLPFENVKGYTGPNEVNMETDSCEQSEAVLDAMEGGSPCMAMAVAALAHERAHTRICEKMGKDVYWSRPPSEIALEEHEMYKLQAASLKKALSKALGEAEITLHGEWRHVLSGEGAQITYFYEFASQPFSKASEGGDRWTFTGEGEARNSIESMIIPEVTCTSSGAITNHFTVAMDTDGVSFGLDYHEQNTGGDMSVTCDYGMSMAVPTGEAASGRLVGSQALHMGDNKLPNSWADTIMAMAAGSGMSVTGEPKTYLTLACPKP